ncbi:MAG: TIGR01459 family HAD-type hydrolase [Rhizobiaceae bacterium]
MKNISSVDEVIADYEVVLCDVWGVIHNGEWAFPAASAALKRVRDAGVCVVLVTNSPRPRAGVKVQMSALAVPDSCYDEIVTSGDATRELITAAPSRVFHIGSDRDFSIYDGTHAELVEEREAQVVVCTGLFDDEVEKPEDYAELLTRLRSRNLPFICANPDIVVERGERMIYCAGAIAREYGLLGGQTLVAGKPHAPIYELALKEAESRLRKPVDRSKVLAIGDGLLTDVKGAMNNGFDLLYISSGIHAKEYGVHGKPDDARLAAWVQKHGIAPIATIPYLA